MKNILKFPYTLIQSIKIVISGVIMIITDSIPGFSGAVMLASTKTLENVWTKWELFLSPKKKGDRLSVVIFYSLFAIGTTLGMFGFAILIEYALKHIATPTFYFFLTAALGSVFLFIKHNKKYLFNHPKGGVKKGIKLMIIPFMVTMSLVILLVLLRGRIQADDLISIEEIDGNNINTTIPWSNISLIILILAAGFFSAFAMFAPGLSGGLIILLFGVYGDIFGVMIAHPFQNILLLMLYFVFVIMGFIVAILAIDKLYRNNRFVLDWILLGNIVASVIGILVIFDVFIPEGLDYLWSFIAISLAAGIIYCVS